MKRDGVPFLSSGFAGRTLAYVLRRNFLSYPPTDSPCGTPDEACDHGERCAEREPGERVPEAIANECRDEARSAGDSEQGRNPEHVWSTQLDRVLPVSHDNLSCEAREINPISAVCELRGNSIRERERAIQRCSPLPRTKIVTRSSKAQIIFSGMPP